MLTVGAVLALLGLAISANEDDEPGTFTDPDPDFDSEDDSGVVLQPDSPPVPQ